VRAAIEEYWNDLKRAHFIDHATRAMSITVGISSNNAGVRTRPTFMVEQTSTGGLLPSYDTQTRVVRASLIVNCRTYSFIALGFTIFFCALEVVEIVDLGFMYFADLWNVMDWLNYLVFFLVFVTIQQFLSEVNDVPCAPICQSIGFQDDWQSMETVRNAKLYLSLCVCIQLLKIIKFTSALVPKMGLAPSVLRKAFADLVFFGVVFFISVIAFSTMFYIQLGPFINDYATQSAAVIALARSLFGDFDVDEIMDNSSGYVNVILFIVYLFVAVFIMLSMFFAILGESQANLRDDQREAKRAGEAEPEYGIFETMYTFWREQLLKKVPVIGPKIRIAEELARAEHIKTAQTIPPTPVDRIEARQLQLNDSVFELTHSLKSLASSVESIDRKVNSLQRSSSSAPKHGQQRSPTRGDSFGRGHTFSGGGGGGGGGRSGTRDKPPPRDRDRRVNGDRRGNGHGADRSHSRMGNGSAEHLHA